MAGDARDMVLILGLERFPGGRNGDPLQYFCLENLMDKTAWQAIYSPWGCSQTRLSTCQLEHLVQFPVLYNRLWIFFFFFFKHSAGDGVWILLFWNPRLRFLWFGRPVSYMLCCPISSGVYYSSVSRIKITRRSRLSISFQALQVARAHSYISPEANTAWYRSKDGSAVKNPPAIQEMGVQSLGWEDPLEEGTATHSSIPAWRIPWTEEPGWLQSRGSQKVRHDWNDWARIEPKKITTLAEDWIDLALADLLP